MKSNPIAGPAATPALRFTDVETGRPQGRIALDAGNERDRVCRSLWQHPAVAGAVVATTALAIGAISIGITYGVTHESKPTLIVAGVWFSMVACAATSVPRFAARLSGYQAV